LDTRTAQRALVTASFIAAHGVIVNSTVLVSLHVHQHMASLSPSTLDESPKVLVMCIDGSTEFLLLTDYDQVGRKGPQ
jgi:hypothetical protein